MARPIEFKAHFTLTSGTNHKHCHLSQTLPDTDYIVSVDIAGLIGCSEITNKTTTSFDVFFSNAPISAIDFVTYIYWDDTDHDT